MQDMPTPDSEPFRTFIHDLIDEDMRTNRWGGRVVTRFPPEPTGTCTSATPRASA